jgi:hypothetical protein
MVPSCFNVLVIQQKHLKSCGTLFWKVSLQTANLEAGAWPASKSLIDISKARLKASSSDYS